MDLVSQAKKAKADTEELLDEAFGFLTRDHNYESLPVEPGGGPYHQFTKRYQLGGRSISFFVDYDRKGIFGMYISPVDLHARQKNHPEIHYIPRSNMYLEVALERRGRPLKWREHESLRDALKYYADLLQREFTKEIGGDFSAYPAIQYKVELVQSGGPENGRTEIGDFDDISAAERSALRKLGQTSLGPNDYVELTAQFTQ